MATKAYAPPRTTSSTVAAERAADDYRWADALTGMVVVIMVPASLFGLFLHDLYRDTTWARSAFRGNDLATLVFAVPALVTSLVLSRRGSSGARLVWTGALNRRGLPTTNP